MKKTTNRIAKVAAFLMYPADIYKFIVIGIFNIFLFPFGHHIKINIASAYREEER